MFRKIIKRFANMWVCPRCGTTNSNFDKFCKECKNRRPF